MHVQTNHSYFAEAGAKLVPSVRGNDPEQDLVEFSLRVAFLALAAAALLATAGATGLGI